MMNRSPLLAMDKSYKRALEVLDKKRRPPRSAIQPAKGAPGLLRIRDGNGELSLKGTPSIVGMKEWLQELGHTVDDINRLNIIHVAGTKGKGSTCAFIDSFLRAYAKRTGFPRKVGLYTSPHLMHPEERIRINREPLSRELFAKYFFEVNDIISGKQPRNFEPRPRYLQLFALLAFHAFIKEGVNAAIFETHHGGEYDSTNVIEKPIVTVVTTLGIDHINQLGSSMESIAWHKAGIFKPGAPAFAAPQEDGAAEALRKRASEKGVDLQFIGKDSSLPEDAAQLKPGVQLTNCSVALAAARSFIDQTGLEKSSGSTPGDILNGLDSFSWPGRFQLVIEGQNQWFLDSAHNELSVGIAAEWFRETTELHSISTPHAQKILIFGQITDQRDKDAVFERLAASLAEGGIQHVIFTTYNIDDELECSTATESMSPEIPDQDQLSFANIWRKAQPGTNIQFQPTIKRALEAARELRKDGCGIQTLVTGSQHLVGGALSLLQKSQKA